MGFLGRGRKGRRRGVSSRGRGWRFEGRGCALRRRSVARCGFGEQGGGGRLGWRGGRKRGGRRFGNLIIVEYGWSRVVSLVWKHDPVLECPRPFGRPSPSVNAVVEGHLTWPRPGRPLGRDLAVLVLKVARTTPCQPAQQAWPVRGGRRVLERRRRPPWGRRRPSPKSRRWRR